MKITKQDLLTAAQEMVDVMELVNNQTDKIPIQLEETLTDDELKTFILKAAKDRYETDKFTELTEDIINEIAHGGVPTPDTLEGDISDADTLKELRTIAKTEDVFKSIRGNLMSYKEVEILKHEMLELLGGNVTEDKIVEEKTPVQAQKQPSEVSKFKSGSTPSKMMKVSEIVTKQPFSGLFAINPDIREKIKKDIEEKGFDKAFPLILWGDVLIDGHTRLIVSRELEIEELPVEIKEFEDQQEALEYAIHNQRDRRNLSDAELLICIEALDVKLSKKEAGAKGGKAKGGVVEEKKEASHEKTAKKLGITKGKVSEARTVLSDEKATKDVKEGTKTIAKAARDVRNEKKVEKKEKEPSKSRIDAVAQVMIQSYSGTDVMIKELIEESDIQFEDFGGESNLLKMKGVVEMVLDILVPFGFVKVLSDEEIHVNDIG